MIRKLYFLFLIIVPLSLLSCIDADEIVNNIDQHNAEENYTSPYMGKWVGTYSGDAINGTLILNVSKSGSIEVTRAENGSTGEVYYTGLQGSSGALNPAPSPKGFVLYGSLHTKSGTWNFQHWSGSWSVSRQ